MRTANTFALMAYCLRYTFMLDYISQFIRVYGMHYILI